MLQYPVRLSRDDNDTFLVEVPDIPEAVTFGDTKEEALARASDALATALEAYIKDRRDIPEPSAAAGPRVTLPALVAAKVDLYREMRANHVGKAELGRRLHWHLPQVDRLLDVHHDSRLDQLEQAFAALGKRLEVRVVDGLGLLNDHAHVAKAVAGTRMRRSTGHTSLGVMSLKSTPRKVARKKR